MKEDEYRMFVADTYPLINFYNLFSIYCTDELIPNEEAKNFQLTKNNIIMMFPYTKHSVNTSSVKKTYINVKGIMRSNTGKCPSYFFCIRAAIWENGNEFEGAIILHTDAIQFLNDTFHPIETKPLYNNMIKSGIMPIKPLELPNEIEQHLNFKSYDDNISTGQDLFKKMFPMGIPINITKLLKGACEYDYDSSIVNFNLHNVDRVYYFKEFLTEKVAICRLDEPKCYVHIIYDDGVLRINYSKDKKVFAKIVLPSTHILRYDRNKIQEFILKDFLYIPYMNSIPGLIK